MLGALITAHLVAAALAPVLARVLGPRVFWVMALAPAAAFGWLVSLAPAITAGATHDERWTWVPALGLTFDLRIGLVQWLLALVVTGVGALVLLYSSWYFSARTPVRCSALLTAFAGVMLGLVTADNLVLLYVFWELTTVLSYLLIGFDPTRRANRSAAMTALIVTTTGGLAMLVGILTLAHQAGTYSLAQIVAEPPSSTLVTIAALLMLVGALSKSALAPFHFWLPGAMAAPTPVSAYLHAAAMVKAGVYLVAVLAPAFADVPGWRPIVATLGATTLLLGGWRALRQSDLKLLLAYGTVSQLGFMVLLSGFGTRATALAGLAMLLAHALFKSTLFLVVGVVDHATGTREIDELNGVWRRLPVTGAAALLGTASMAALPPLFGFTAKEAALESLTYLVGDANGVGTRPLPAVLLIIAIVAGSALTVAYSLRFWWGAFATKRDAPATPLVHRPSPAMIAAPVLLSLAGLVGGFVSPAVSTVLSRHAATLTNGDESHGLALWHGLTLPLLLSLLAITGGILLFWQRTRVARVQATFPHVYGADEFYAWSMHRIDWLAVEITARVQRGSLASYTAIILSVVVVLTGGALVNVREWPTMRIADHPAQVLIGALLIVAGVLSATSRGRMRTVMLVGATGYGVALLFLLHGAPDLALTQVLVETVSLAVFVLVLRKLPKYFTDRPLQSTRWWRIVLATLVGATFTLLAVVAGGARLEQPVSTAYYEAAYSFGYGRNIVNVTLVDTRAWDTLGEISVLVLAATGVASLVFLRSRVQDVARPSHVRSELPRGSALWLRATGALDPMARSLLFEVITRLLFGVMILVSIYLLIAGHNLPGGGFAGGLVAGLALLVRYLAAGSAELDEAAPVDAGRLLGAGLLISVLTAVAPVPFGGRVFQSYDVHIIVPGLEKLSTPLGDWTLLGDIHLVTSTAFDVGVYLIVLGTLLDLVRSLGSGIDQHEDDNLAPVPEPESQFAIPGRTEEAR